MTETYYKKLNLPANPLINGFDRTNLTVNKPGAGQLQPTADLSLLNQETLDAYASVGLEPSRIFVLGNKSFVDDDPALDRRCAAHSDLHWVDGKWEYEIFAINYELTPELHKVVWKFWDIKAQPVMPDDPKTEQHTWLAGLHYNARQVGSIPNFGDPNDYTVIDQFVLDRPTLCRVETPHSVHHTNPNTQRYGLSIRFKHKFTSWNQVVDSLTPLFI